ncbi:MAG: hypothetical protein JO337_02505 [Acidimicrobiales bacterium]|nr:hypothetical protein [Acidimicrobiales bacterium]
MAGESAPPIRGTDLDGAPAELIPGPGRTVVLFMTSTCRSCRPVWESFATHPDVVVVTPDPATENRRKLRRLAGDRRRVIMSSAAWLDYVTGPAPWTVIVEDGTVVGNGVLRDGPWS